MLSWGKCLSCTRARQKKACRIAGVAGCGACDCVWRSEARRSEERRRSDGRGSRAPSIPRGDLESAGRRLFGFATVTVKLLTSQQLYCFKKLGNLSWGHSSGRRFIRARFAQQIRSEALSRIQPDDRQWFDLIGVFAGRWWPRLTGASVASVLNDRAGASELVPTSDGLPA